MLAVKLREGAMVVGVQPLGEDRIVPVVGWRPGYTRAEAERDGYIIGETEAETEIAVLKRLRRGVFFFDATESEWRELLRSTESYAIYAELDDWSTPPAGRPMTHVLELAEAEMLVREGFADPVEADLSKLEAEVASWG